MKTKICTKCKKSVKLDNFYETNSVVSCWCKDCYHEYQRINKIRIKKQKHLNYLKNKVSINQKCLEYYRINKEKLLERMKNYRETHKNARKEYLKKNHNEIRKYVNNKRNTDLNFKLTHCLRNRVRKAIRGICKTKSTLELIGCSLEFLKKHLESQFTQGMSWKNYNYRGWHIDHIKPCAKFDLSKPSEQRKCFHYTNLQPLWREDNQKKGRK